MHLSTKSTLLSILVLAGFVFGGEPESKEPAKEPAKVLLRERTVYVPYDKLKDTFEKEGRGIFMPYEEFLKLWNAAQVKPAATEEPKPPVEAVITGGSYSGVAKEESARFEVTYKIKALGKNWSEIFLPLYSVAVETVSVSDPQAVLAPNGDGYSLHMPKPGEYTVTLAFSVRVNAKPGTRSIEFGIPPTAVSRLELVIPEKDLRVDVTPKMAATTTTTEENSTRLLAFVGNASSVALVWMPPVVKAAKAEALVTAAQAMHVTLGERILRLDTVINFKIERDEEDLFRVKLPQNMQLLSVQGNNIREWTSEEGVLNVRLHAPVKDSYALTLRCERILEKTPEKLEVPFTAVTGALREEGYLVLTHEHGLRVLIENSTGLSQVDPKELPESLRQPEMLAGFRYLAQPLGLNLKIEQVLPQMHSSVTAIVALGLEEDSLSGWVDYQISKVGVFTLKLRFPGRWEISSVGDAQTVEDFQVAPDGNFKIATVNLKNSALGTFRLPFKLSGPGRAAAGELTVEPLLVLGTLQDTGLFGVSAPKAFKLTTIEHPRVTPESVQRLVASGILAQLPQDLELPLAYSYSQQTVQQPAAVKVALESRKTEIRVTGFHKITVAETGVKVSQKLKYFVEFAAVEKLYFSAPSELDDKLHIECQGLKEKKKTTAPNGRSLWELSLQDKLLGPLTVSIEHEQDLKGLESEKPQPLAIPNIRAEGEDVKLQAGYIAIHKDGLLEIKPEATELEPLDTIDLPAELKPAGPSNIYLSFHYFQPAYKLTLSLTRHDSLQLTSTIVDLMRATFVVSEEKKLAARVVLYIENAKGEQYLELSVPENSIRSVTVQGVSTNPLKRKDGATLVKLPTGGPFAIEVVYATPLEGADKLGSFGGLSLETPKIMAGVPVNKVELDLYVPEDYACMGFRGTLHLRTGNDRRFPQLEQAGSFPTQGTLLTFQTLSPVGTVSLIYCYSKLFWLFNTLVFLAALGAGWYVIFRRKLAPLAVCLGFILVPLCARWLTASDASQTFTAWLLAGLVLSLALAWQRGRQRLHAWREEQIALAPDPFLEDANVKPAPKDKGNGKKKSDRQEGPQ